MKKSALEKEMISILENHVESDQRVGVLRGIIPNWFMRLKIGDEETRESTYSCLYGFIWSMYCMGLIDEVARKRMVRQLIKLAE